MNLMLNFHALFVELNVLTSPNVSCRSFLLFCCFRMTSLNFRRNETK